MQEELLKKALTILKNGKTMVYSTCSILKEENEEVINKILPKFNVEIVSIDESIIMDIPKLPSSINGAITICPSNLYEGFFMCKIRKLH